MEGNVLGAILDLTQGSKIPQEILNEHISVIQNSVGSRSGLRNDLPKKSLQELANAAAEGGKTGPSDFVHKYNEILREESSNLVAPMMDILHGILFSPNQESIRKVISSKTDLQTLKERLLQQVGDSSKVEIESLRPLKSPVSGARPLTKRPFSDRPYLTNDFIPLTELQSTDNIGSLGRLPIPSQDSAIVRDLLYLLVGVSGVHIKPDFDTSERVKGFKIDETLDPTLRELVSRITPLFFYYSNVVRFTEIQSGMGCGRVNQALGGALSSLLKDYYIFVAQLEGQYATEGLTLSKLWFYVQPSMLTLEMLSDIVGVIEKTKATGGKTLSLLHEQMILHSGRNDKCLHIGEFLTSSAAKPYFQILSRWIHKGIISDPGHDFFVEDNEIIERYALPLEYSDDYWERRYSLKINNIPSFLHPHVDMILRTGKYLNVIQQCEKVIQWPEKTEDITYTTNAEEYTKPLEEAYAFASKTLLDLLVKDRDLVGHLRSVKHYFLLDQGDFIVQFMDLCESELLQNVNQVEPTRLESLLELALRTSGANADPYKDNVGIELLPYDLIYQMCRILSIDTESESEYREPTDTDELSGLEAFAFGYEVQWPISLILNRKSLACYQMLLRHLFYCKHVERQLCRVWVVTKVTKELPQEQFTIYGPSFALKQKMLNFLQNLEYYMTFEVLEPAWEDLISKIRSGKVINVDQVLQIHSDFLSTCLNDCMLSSPSLLTTVKKLLGVCVEFSAFMEAISDPEESDIDVENFEDDVAKFDLRFSSVLLSLLDKIAQIGHENYNEKILNILHRLDFNGFYSRALDKFGSCTGGAAVASSVSRYNEDYDGSCDDFDGDSVF